MQDLNDLRLFASVVQHGGFSPASRETGVPKSRLSKRVASLEAELGVRLLERTTRRFRVTDVGAQFYDQCRAVLAGADAAEAIAQQAQAEPRGLVRASCPPGMIDHRMADLLPPFLLAHPQVRLQVIVTNRRVDLIEERIDVALRVRAQLDTDPMLTVRQLGSARLLLAASPAFVAGLDSPITLDSLPGVASISFNESTLNDVWHLEDPEGRTVQIPCEPRLICGDFEAMRAAAVAGLGVALLPDQVCNRAFAAGDLVPVLPQWTTPPSVVHMVYASKTGLPPAVRAFIDHIAREMPGLIRACSEVV